MLPLLSLHALASQRGDGLRPELKALLERHAGLEAGVETGLAAVLEPEAEQTDVPSHSTEGVTPDEPA